MTKRMILRGPLAVVFALTAACGHKGPLLPPAVRVPQPPGDFTCLQRGGRILLQWTNPANYISGEAMMPGGAVIEVWVLETPQAEDATPAAASDIVAKGQVVGRREGRPGGPGEFVYELAPREIATSVLHFALRARDARGRVSEPTEVLACAPQALPLPPTDLRVRVLRDRLEVEWTAPEAAIDGRPAAPTGYLVLRAEEGGPFRPLNAEPLEKPPFVDQDFEFDRPYRYVVRAAANTAVPFLTSDDSPVLEVRVKDEFPPEPPQGLVTVAGEGFISLGWEPRPEKDLAGYKVWRRAADEPDFRAVTPQPILETAYTDRAVEKGVRYAYALTAVDLKGNESARSAAAAETAKGGRP